MKKFREILESAPKAGDYIEIEVEKDCPAAYEIELIAEDEGVAYIRACDYNYTVSLKDLKKSSKVVLYKVGDKFEEL